MEEFCFKCRNFKPLQTVNVPIVELASIVNRSGMTHANPMRLVGWIA
jgi:hypothetical protein